MSDSSAMRPVAPPGGAPLRSDLPAFLLGHGDAPSEQMLRRARLAGYAYTVLPGDHPTRAALRADYLEQLALQTYRKQETLPLVRAWHEAGIETLLYKGIFLAEFVYPVPGARAHADIDLLVHPDEAERAVEIALQLGWSEAAGGLRRSLTGHCVTNLIGPSGLARIDLHRHAVHSKFRWSGAQRRVTDAMWARSEPAVWGDVPVRVPAAVDALLVGLIQQRCWGGDAWRLKPSDMPDFRMLLQYGSLSKDDLVRRAEELGCTRTLQIFLQRCDPFAQRLSFAQPARFERVRWELATARERGGHLALPLSLERLPRVPRTARNVALALPTLFAVHRALARETDITALLDRLTPRSAPAGQGSARLRQRLVQGVRWGVRLFPRNPRGDCLLRSLALYALLRRHGWPAVFVSGVRREGAEVVGHAWVELDGRVLDELNEPGNRHIYHVNVVHPAPPAS
jgi:hypothetical protein